MQQHLLVLCTRSLKYCNFALLLQVPGKNQSSPSRILGKMFEPKIPEVVVSYIIITPVIVIRDVWRMYLERGEFELAKEYCKV